MNLQPPSSGASQQAAIIWWRNWVALFTVIAFVVFSILLLMHSATWILIVVLVGAAFGLKQVVNLSRRARDPSLSYDRD